MVKFSTRFKDKIIFYEKAPLDELLTAIDNIIGDLGKKIDGAYADFDKVTNEYNSEVRRLESAIATA